MPTYIELMEQAEKLMAQAESVREKEIAETIAEIKEKMRLYGLTPEDLGFGKTGGRASTKRTKQGGQKYRGPNGETWAGGRGRKPGWVVSALKEGRSLEDFLVR